MKQILTRGFFIVVLCSCFSAAAYYFINVYAMMLSLPLFGIGLSRVIIDLVAELRHYFREAASRKISGKHYSFRGITLHVVEDDDYAFWFPADEIRKAVGQGAADRALALTYPTGWCEMGKPLKGYLRDDALLIYLSKETSLQGIKFKIWVERTIAFQAKSQRERFGIRLEDPRAVVPTAPPPNPYAITQPQG